MAILDSGDRTEYASGAVRDIGEGKGDCSLLPLLEVAEFLEYVDRGDMKLAGSALRQFARFIDSVKEGNIEKNLLYSALYRFSASNKWDASTMLMELSIHFSEGAKKYERDNWRKGIPASSFTSSGVRHYLKWKAGFDDERHDRAVCWNWFCLLWTLINKPECNDLVKQKTKEAEASKESMERTLAMWNDMFTQNPFCVSNKDELQNGKPI